MIIVSLVGYSFKIVKFMIFMTFTKSRFNKKKSRDSHPKIRRIIGKKSQKLLVSRCQCLFIIHSESIAQF